MEEYEHKALRILCNQYFQLISIDKIDWPIETYLKKLYTQQWIYDHLFGESMPSKYSPPQRYKIQFLNRLISIIENLATNVGQSADADENGDTDAGADEYEISDDLMNALGELMLNPVASEALALQERAYITYTFPEISGHITLLESRNILGAGGTTGQRTWEASLHLAKFLTTSHGSQLVTNKRILELGAGTGLISLLCRKYLNASSVLATDGSQEVVKNLEDNVFISGLSNASNIDVQLFPWGNWFLPDEDDQDKKIDLILGADITYDPDLFPYLLSTIRQALEFNINTNIVIAATERNESTLATFIQTCDLAGFQNGILPFDTVQDEGPFYPVSVPIHIMTLRPKPGLNLDSFSINSR